MAYTLHQMELFALSETRRSVIYDNIRHCAAYGKGAYMSSDASLAVLDDWLASNRQLYISPLGEVDQLMNAAEWCLNGATRDEYRLYCRIEQQRVAIRTEERALRTGKSQYSDKSLLRTLRADFKSFLKEVQW